MIAHGIQTEKSHLRAHVGIVVKQCYVFPQAALVGVMSKFEVGYATQPGANGWTGKGYKVPWVVVPGIQVIPFPAEWVALCTKDLSTSEKGDFAIYVVRHLLRQGKISLPLDHSVTEDVNLQREGEDLVAWGQWRIEVKCDYGCGSEKLGGTGNLFIQTEESNPFAQH
jgi:hypothetical protein